jgi:hypothetical protein
MTADAAEAFSSVRRDKLISVSPWTFIVVLTSAYCSVRRRSQYRLSDEAANTVLRRFEVGPHRRENRTSGLPKRPKAAAISEDFDLNA